MGRFRDDVEPVDRHRHRHRRQSRLGSALEAIRPYTPPLNFITIHYAYFIVVCLVSSVIFWGSSNPPRSISYVDSLFLVVSAMTEAGLNTVNLSQMTTWQQTMLWLLIILGSQIWVSIWTVLARKRVFELRFEDIVRQTHLRDPPTTPDRRRTLTKDLPIVKKVRTFGKGKATAAVESLEEGTGGGVQLTTLPIISGPVAVQKLSESVPTKHGDSDESVSPKASVSPTLEPAEEDTLSRPTAGNDHVAFASNVVDAPRSRDGGTSSAFSRPHGGGIFKRQLSTVSESGTIPHRVSHQEYLTSGKVGRNAQFHNLSSEEREHLGGTEYRALKVLSVIVPVYWFSWQFLGCLALGAWIANNQPQPALDNAINPWWNGIFNGASAFNNSGMSVLDANMIPYQNSYFVLICMGAMILAGNTAYPVFLRVWLWTMLKLLKLLTYEESLFELKRTLEYILKYPRRVYTNLFPLRTTWWLVFMLFVLNGTDWLGFELLNLGNPALAEISQGSRVIDGLFQAVAVRSGGFYVVSIPTLYIGLQVLYVIMMYISVYPVVITMRHSNVYEERSLGIYAEDHLDPESSSPEKRPASSASSPTPHRMPSVLGRALRRTLSEWHGVGAARQTTTADSDAPESRISFISHQIRGQLTHDLWLLVVAVFAIVTIETRHFLEDPVSYSVFNVLFEIVSAYGCVGISVGLPNQAFSFSGGWYTGSKVVLCLVMLRGRHRGLPVALDRAVRLPGDDLVLDEEDYRIRRSISARQQSIDVAGAL